MTILVGVVVLQLWLLTQSKSLNPMEFKEHKMVYFTLFMFLIFNSHGLVGKYRLPVQYYFTNPREYLVAESCAWKWHL